MLDACSALLTPMANQNLSSASAHPSRLKVVTSVLVPSPVQMQRLKGIFGFHIQVQELIATFGIDDATNAGAEQFFKRHRTALEPFLQSLGQESEKRALDLINDVFVAGPIGLRRAVRGHPCVAGEMVSLPVPQLGPVRMRFHNGAYARPSRNYSLLEDLFLVWHGDRFEVELHWWNLTPRSDVPEPIKLRIFKAAKPPAAPKPPTPAVQASQMRAREKAVAEPKVKTRKSKRAKPELAAATTSERLLKQQEVTPQKPKNAGKGKSRSRATFTNRARTGLFGVYMPPQNFAPEGSAVPMISVDCSCMGNNATCFRCDGRGYYEKKAPIKPPSQTVLSEIGAKSIVRHENDSRGGSYGVRENGRFLSNADHDAYDDEAGA